MARVVSFVGTAGMYAETETSMASKLTNRG